MKTDNLSRYDKMTNAIILMVLSWLTVSPMMFRLNKKYDCIKSRAAIIMLFAISPLVVYIMSGLTLLLFDVELFNGIVKALLPKYSYALEMTQFSDNPLLRIFEFSFLPVYALCVLLIFAVMAVTGWSYTVASVNICEYFIPAFFTVAANLMIVYMIICMGRMKKKGCLLMVLPLLGEIFMLLLSANTYAAHIIRYNEMTDSQIFRHAVNYLLELGNAFNTTYVIANMIVYVLPLVIILALGFSGWIIYRKNRTLPTPPSISNH